MTLRDVISEADLKMLLDIFRSHFHDVELAERVYFQTLDLEIDNLALDYDFVRDVAEWISSGAVDAGFMSALYKIVAGYHSALGVSRVLPRITPNYNLPIAGSRTHEFWLWLAVKPRSKSEAVNVWPKDEVENLWAYFRSGRLKKYGYQVNCTMKDGDEVLEMIRCQETLTLAGS